MAAFQKVGLCLGCGCVFPPLARPPLTPDAYPPAQVWDVAAATADMPTLICVKTTIGFGSLRQGTSKVRPLSGPGCRFLCLPLEAGPVLCRVAAYLFVPRLQLSL